MKPAIVKKQTTWVWKCPRCGEYIERPIKPRKTTGFYCSKTNQDYDIEFESGTILPTPAKRIKNAFAAANKNFLKKANDPKFMDLKNSKVFPRGMLG